MVIPVERLGGWLNAGRVPQLQNANCSGRAIPQNTTGRDGKSAGTIPRRRRHTSFPFVGKAPATAPLAQHDRVGTAQGAERLSQPPGGKQAVTGILRRDQHKSPKSRARSPVLKTIIQQM